MTSRQDIKARVRQAIDEKADEIVRVSRTILENPEAGFREVKTAKLVSNVFSGWGIDHRTGLALTGVKGVVDSGNTGPTVGVIGELDSLIVSEHPHADSETAAAHACGHHAQIGMMLGVAGGLLSSGVMDQLGGRVALFAVPAEEYIEIEYRDELRRDGKLEFLGGKPELIRLGEMDDVDLALMCHTTSIASEKQLCISGTNNGTLAKKIRFLGRAAHAGGAPHLGVNALNAASLALMAIHANRETFRSPGPGHHTGASDHHQGGRGGERRARRRADGDLRARGDGGGNRRCQPEGGPGAAGGGHGRGRTGSDNDHPRLSAAGAGRDDERDVPGQRGVSGGGG